MLLYIDIGWCLQIAHVRESYQLQMTITFQSLLLLLECNFMLDIWLIGWDCLMLLVEVLVA